jgi:6-phosphogluconate dehydrogenase
MVKILKKKIGLAKEENKKCFKKNYSLNKYKIRIIKKILKLKKKYNVNHL